MTDPIENLTEIANAALTEAKMGRIKAGDSLDLVVDIEEMRREVEAAIEQVEELRDVAEEIAKFMVLASTPSFLWRKMHELGPRLDAALSPFYESGKKA